MSCGIILAAGESTRLPSKVLLPISEQLIAIESAIVMSQYCCAQTVVVCGCSLVMDALKMRGWQNNISYVFQPKPLGVCDAVARGACASLHDKCCVFFGDNIYPTADVNHIKKCLGMSKKFASVREVDLPGLDGFTTSEGWVSRKENPKLKLAGWVSLQRSIAMGILKLRK